jgi:hypothetical protein
MQCPALYGFIKAGLLHFDPLAIELYMYPFRLQQRIVKVALQVGHGEKPGLVDDSRAIGENFRQVLPLPVVKVE